LIVTFLVELLVVLLLLDEPLLDELLLDLDIHADLMAAAAANAAFLILFNSLI